MKPVLLTCTMMFLLLLSACNREDAHVAPDLSATNTPVYARAIDELNLTDAQAAFVDELFYLDEDLSVLLSESQLSALTTVVDGIAPVVTDDDRINPRLFVDVDAVFFYNLIVRANPDMGSETKAALKELIQQSARNRAQILKNRGDAGPERVRALLKAEHERLIAAMTALLTREQIANARALKARIEAQREAERERLTALRIARQIHVMDRVLDLSDRQETAIRQILINRDKAIKEIVEKFRGNPEDMRAALQQLQKRIDAAIAALLTQEQLIKWRRWKG